MRLARSSPRILIALGLLLIMCSILALYAGNADTAKSQPKFDSELYTNLMSQRLESLGDVIDEYEYQQLEFVPVLPPGPEGTLQQDAGIYAFDAAGFPTEFTKGLVPDQSLGVASYHVWAFEDPETRNRIIINSKGDKLASIPPPADYQSDWYLLEMYPLLHGGEYSPGTIAFTEATYDPARLVVGLRLIAKQDIEKYVWLVSLQEAASASAETLAAVAPASGGGIGPMMMYTGAPVSHLTFTCIEIATNSTRVTVAYPVSYTNKLEIFTCSNLVAGWFYSAGTTNINPATNWVEWSDSAGAWTNFTPRFYACGNGDLDTDGDGLKDAQEKYVWHTSATRQPGDAGGSEKALELSAAAPSFGGC